MAISITEKILGNNKILTDNYFTNTINLVKSIIVVNSTEADLYNEYLSVKYPTLSVDLSVKSTWRYYKHLNSQYYDIDKDIVLRSLDNGMDIILDKPTINLHKKSKDELLKFGLYYKELVDKYPEQELFIRSCITESPYSTIQEIIDLDNYTIVSSNLSLVEENEDNLLPKLQNKITNYENIWLIPYYHVSDNLFLASQYSTFYQFLFTSILSIRLENAKTINAHSYHIINYLASHHFLDKYYRYLTRYQALFLYRNMLYLDNHSGKIDTFETLIDKLFTPRNISVVTYNYKQKNSVDDINNIEYKFKQKLLNNKNLVYSNNDYTLKNLDDKVRDLVIGNPREIDTREEYISDKFKNSLFNFLTTKDIEFSVIDNTDNVRYKIIPTIIDYWVYLLKQNKVNFILSIVDPITNQDLRLNTSDAFKLFTILLYRSNNRILSEFPPYTIKHAFHKELPLTENLLKVCYDKKYWYKDTITTIKNAIPSYTTVVTSYQFEQYVFGIYKLNLGLSLFLNNLSEKDDHGQFELIVDRLNTSEDYTFNDETVEHFLDKIGLSGIDTYNQQMLENFCYNILNKLFDSKLDFINKYKYIQDALIGVFEKFNSYTVQIIHNYYSNSTVVAGLRDTRYAVSEDIHNRYYYFNAYTMSVDMEYKILDTTSIDLNVNGYSSYSYYCKEIIDINTEIITGVSDYDNVIIDLNNRIIKDVNTSTDILIKESVNLNVNGYYSFSEYSFTYADFSVDIKCNSNLVNKASVIFNTTTLNDLGDSQWLITQSSEPDLLFLASNL